MNLKKTIMNSLFIAIGIVLGQVIPPIFFGMKPGTGLIILFIIIMFNKDDYKSCMSVGFVMGILSAATTTFPGGQLPNFIASIVTTNALYLLLKTLSNRFNDQIKFILISSIGTIISGATFLFFALIMVGLPANFNTMLLSVVIPASIINTIVGSIVYFAFNAALKRASVK